MGLPITTANLWLLVIGVTVAVLNGAAARWSPAIAAFFARLAARRSSPVRAVRRMPPRPALQH